MDTLLWIVLLSVGTFVFVIVNRIFNITYFGVKAIFGTWMFCVLATGLVGIIASTFIAMYYKWILGGLAVIALLVYIGKKGEKGKPVSEAPNNTGIEEKNSEVAAIAPVVKTAEVEKGEFDVILASAGAKKMEVIAVIREVTGLDLLGAKAIVDGAPNIVKEKVAKALADTIKAKLEGAGATVEVK